MSDSDPYREKYVVFIDMLGFSDMVRASGADFEKRKAVMEAIGRLKDTACNNPHTGTLVSYFSDCIVISSDRTSNGLRDIINSSRTIAENLLQVDVLIRGGFAVGGIHHDGDFMFGPGMLEAYDLERLKTGARQPTIIASSEFWADVVRAGAWAADWFIHDSDESEERHYLHYLRSYAQYTPGYVGTLVLEEPARLVRHFIARRLATHEGSLREKAEWLRRYWDETVGVNGLLGMVDEIADLADPVVRPYRTQLFILQTPMAATETVQVEQPEDPFANSRL